MKIIYSIILYVLMREIVGNEVFLNSILSEMEVMGGHFKKYIFKITY